MHLCRGLSQTKKRSAGNPLDCHSKTSSKHSSKVTGIISLVHTCTWPPSDWWWILTGILEVQATIYMSAGMRCEHKQSESKCEQRLLECEGTTLKDNTTKSDHNIDKSRSQTHRTKSWMMIRTQLHRGRVSPSHRWAENVSRPFLNNNLGCGLDSLDTFVDASTSS